MINDSALTYFQIENSYNHCVIRFLVQDTLRIRIRASVGVRVYDRMFLKTLAFRAGEFVFSAHVSQSSVCWSYTICLF